MSRPSTSANYRRRSSSILTIAFVRYFENEKHEGTVQGGVDGSHNADYLPEDALLRYFTEECIQHIQSQLYPQRTASDIAQMYDPALIRRKYPKVLATLLYIERGELLNEFLSNSLLDDKHLPFFDAARFPGSKEDFQNFFDAQWKFFILPLKYQRIVNYESSQILPFKSVDKLGGGNGGKAYLIAVHPHHNQLNPADGPTDFNQTAEPSTSQQNPNLFVVKVFNPKGRAREDWLREARNHVVIRTNKGLVEDGGIVGFHGCFSHGSTFGILLEYASMGNLEQMFRTQEPPRDHLDIFDIWKSFLNLLSTLKCLRHFEHADRGTLQLCHFDIKPNNILIFPSQEGRRYGFRFKIGDLGSSEYCSMLDVEPSNAAYMLQRQGTRTYGAPECCRILPGSQNLGPLNWVQPWADLWSYGCVGSELATWVTRGYGALLSYRESRRDNQSSTFGDGDCFHNGYQTLPYINTHHNRLLDNIDELQCNATVLALQLIDENMLQFNPKNRKHPGILVHEAANKMKQIETEIAMFRSRQVVTDAHALAGSQNAYNSGTPTTPTQRGAIRYLRGGGTDANLFATGRQRLNMAQDRYPFGYMEQSTTPVSERESQDSLASSQNPGRMRSTSQDERIGSRVPSNESEPSTTGPSQQARGPEHNRGASNASNSHATARSRVRSGSQQGLGLSIDALRRQSMQLARRSHVEVPFLSVSDALVWRYKTKSQSWWDKIRKRADKDHEEFWRQLERDCHNRDFKILIDDSSSMIEHWDDVAECAGLLAFCTSRYDDDGLDLSFTFSSREKKNTKGDEPITKQVQKKKPKPPKSANSQKNNRANIEAALEKILGEYQKEVHARRARAVPESLKGMVLFVLTDGLWWPNSDAKIPLASLVRTMSTPAYNLPRNQVGVQFIRFGQSEVGMQRLEELDDFFSFDVVDVEEWKHGNVWKMLLGSINRDFDWSDTAALSQRSFSPVVGPSATHSRQGSEHTLDRQTPRPADQHYDHRPSGSYVRTQDHLASPRIGDASSSQV